MTTYNLMSLPDEPEEVPSIPISWATHKPDPLESIADSLRRLVAWTERPVETLTAVLESTESVCATCTVNVDILEETREKRDDWEDKHRTLFDLVGEIRAIVKPSSSKVSLEVKAAIDRWAAPVVEPEGEDFNGDPLKQPAHDAPVEEWRDYAYNRGLSAPDVDEANRSQIRTMLSIPHGGAE